MKCKRNEWAIALYAGGDMPPRRSRKLARHLESCGHCNKILVEMRGMRMAMSRERDVELNPGQLEAFRSGFREELARVRTQEHRSRLRWRRFACATAASLLLAGVAGVGALRAAHTGGATQPERVEGRVRAAVESRPASAAEPMTIRIATDDPNLVIYWIAETGPGIS